MQAHQRANDLYTCNLKVNIKIKITFFISIRVHMVDISNIESRKFEFMVPPAHPQKCTAFLSKVVLYFQKKNGWLIIDYFAMIPVRRIVGSHFPTAVLSSLTSTFTWFSSARSQRPRAVQAWLSFGVTLRQRFWQRRAMTALPFFKSRMSPILFLLVCIHS